ncbi:MAG: aminoacyl-tRNA hydrolase [Anaerolineales bacterium]|jgi:PTH1 family peptidyl-tRNA hydrolase
MTDNTFLIVGLGNPGREYKDNRHNFGFMLIDRLSIRLNARLSRVQAKALVGSVNYEGDKLILAKPQTYMNLSGQSIQGLARFYKLPLENMLVAHDDLDLPFGTVRVRPGGGPGGQKGVASAIERLGTKDFRRLRLGIGRPPGRMDPAAYVLQDFAQSDLALLSEILDHAAEAVLTFVTEGLDSAMNKFNGEVQP